MRVKKQSQRGVTILEILLVLSIGVILIMMSIRQYQALSVDNNIRQLKANVNTILQGMAAFYYVNCNGSYNPTTGVTTPGLLNPYSNNSTTYVVNVNSQLVTPGFISTTYSTIVPFNALVNTSNGGQPAGYVAQFNRVDQARNICTSGTNVVNGPNDPNCTSTAKTGISVLWLAQVAVELNSNIPSSEYTTYKNLTDADCLSALNGTQVNACSQNTPGNYLVWERLPSMVTTENQTTTTLWGNNVNLSEFKQLYTQYPNLSTDTKGPEQGMMPPSEQTHYYLCGG